MQIRTQDVEYDPNVPLDNIPAHSVFFYRRIPARGKIFSRTARKNIFIRKNIFQIFKNFFDVVCEIGYRGNPRTGGVLQGFPGNTRTSSAPG
jgi:hypothetical protein